MANRGPGEEFFDGIKDADITFEYRALETTEGNTRGPVARDYGWFEGGNHESRKRFVWSPALPQGAADPTVTTAGTRKKKTRRCETRSPMNPPAVGKA